MEIAGYEFEKRKKALDVLLGLFDRLGDLAGATVLIGGWAPFFLTRGGAGDAAAHIGSLDIDLMVDHEAIKGRTQALLERLDAEHFYHSYSGPRFTFYRDVLRAGNEPLVVKLDLVSSDFYLNGQPVKYRKLRQLTLRTARAGGIAFIDPVPIEVTKLGRAIRFRLVNPVGFLVLKGMVMAERERPKDFYDVYTLLSDPVLPVEEIAAAVRRLAHPTVEEGMRKVRAKFCDAEAPGPYGVASFLGVDGGAAAALRARAVETADRLLLLLGLAGRVEPRDYEGEIDFTAIRGIGRFEPLRFDYPDLVARMLGPSLDRR